MGRNNLVGWFEIPVNDMERAVRFYNAVFDLELKVVNLGKETMAWFPFNPDESGSAGSLIYAPEHYKVTKDGVLVYFTCPHIDAGLQKAKVMG